MDCHYTVHVIPAPSVLTVQVSNIRASFEPIADFDEVGRWPSEWNFVVHVGITCELTL
jgi:hypothetical protein